MPSYHRRIRIEPLDIYAMSLVKIGSGSNLPGYYMYHGGTNPMGKFHTMNEKQDTRYMNHNDLPAVTYDFQTPLAQFGQINGHYHWLRRTHQFLADFGDALSHMDLNLPEDAPTEAKVSDKLRWAVRSDGQSGYVFVNNYQRLRTLSPKKNVRFTLRLQDRTLRFPQKAMTVPSGASCFFPFNLNVEGVTLDYATAQPFARLCHEDVTTLFLAEVKGIPVELMIDGQLYRDLKPGTGCVIERKTPAGGTLRIVVLNEDASLQCYKTERGGKEYMYMSRNGLSFDGGEMYIEEWGADALAWGVYPDAPCTHPAAVKQAEDGIFARYALQQPCTSAAAPVVKEERPAAPARKVKMGARNVAEQPSEADFLNLAARWSIGGLERLEHPADFFLKVSYEGDAARVYADGKLVQDNFYNGQDMYVPVSDLVGKEVSLYILPLSKDYPIYLPEAIRTRLAEKGQLLELKQVQLVERRRVCIK